MTALFFQWLLSQKQLIYRKYIKIYGVGASMMVVFPEIVLYFVWETASIAVESDEENSQFIWIC